MERIEHDKWYVTVNCSFCGEIIPISKVPSPQDEPYPVHRKTTDLACPLCQHVDTYLPALMCRRVGQSFKASLGLLNKVTYGTKSPKHPAGPPMTLGNMRHLGVHNLVAFCLNDACRTKCRTSEAEWCAPSAAGGATRSKT